MDDQWIGAFEQTKPMPLGASIHFTGQNFALDSVVVKTLNQNTDKRRNTHNYRLASVHLMCIITFKIILNYEKNYLIKKSYTL